MQEPHVGKKKVGVLLIGHLQFQMSLSLSKLEKHTSTWHRLLEIKQLVFSLSHSHSSKKTESSHLY